MHNDVEELIKAVDLAKDKYIESVKIAVSKVLPQFELYFSVIEKLHNVCIEMMRRASKETE